jgi:ABC-type sugar transport system substrate-binding protein
LNREFSGHKDNSRWQVALISFLALAHLCLADSVSGSGKKVVGATVLSLQSPYLVAVNDAMKAEAVRQGFELDSLDPERSVARELEQVESLIKQKVDLIVMIPADQRGSQTAAKLINKAGIPLLLLKTKLKDDFVSNGGKFVAYVGSDDTVAGQMEGQYLVDQLPEGGNVVYLVVEYGLSVTELRKAGFESVIKDHPKLRVVTELQGYASTAKSKTIMESLLQKYGKGELQALVAQNDEMAIGASSAIRAADRLGEFQVLIGIDGMIPGLNAVKFGSLTATVVQDAVGHGTQAMVVAGKILAGETVEPQLMLPFKLVTKGNVSSFNQRPPAQ